MSNNEFTESKLYTLTHQDIAQTSQDHLSVDLLEPYNVNSQGNSYALTAVCKLTGYHMTTPIKDQKMMPVANINFQTSC